MIGMMGASCMSVLNVEPAKPFMSPRAEWYEKASVAASLNLVW